MRKRRGLYDVLFEKLYGNRHVTTDALMAYARMEGFHVTREEAIKQRTRMGWEEADVKEVTLDAIPALTDCRFLEWDANVKDWVYFFYTNNSEVGELVKIGHSIKPFNRRRVLENEFRCELTPLGYIRGGRPLEQALHQIFRSSRVRYEWFEYRGVSAAIHAYVTMYGDDGLLEVDSDWRAA